MPILLLDINVFAFKGGGDIAEAGDATLGEVCGELGGGEVGDDDVGGPAGLVVSAADFEDVGFYYSGGGDGFALRDWFLVDLAFPSKTAAKKDKRVA